jgi:hypothetical protein
MPKRRAQAVGYRHEAGSNLAGRRDDSEQPIRAHSDVASLGSLAELDLRMTVDGFGQPGVEVESPDPEPRPLAAMRGEGHVDRWPLGKPKLNAVERRRPARYNIILEAQLAQCWPATRHQPFATRLVARKGLLVEDNHPLSAARGKQS